MPWIVPMANNLPGKFFTWDELTRSSAATKLGITNKPGPEHRINLRMLVYQCLDPLREHLGRPVRVTSGYRCHEVNDAVGGSVRSFHTRGLAADIK